MLIKRNKKVRRIKKTRGNKKVSIDNHKDVLEDKIGFVDNEDLGFCYRNGRVIPGGHYVFVDKVDRKKGKCHVRAFTSLEDPHGVVKANSKRNIRRGYLHPIPISESTFSRWTGLNYNPDIVIPISSIENIGTKNVNEKQLKILKIK